MKHLKQENKKTNTFTSSMLERCMFHILQYQDLLLWFLLSLCHQSRSSSVPEEKALYIIFLIAAKSKYLRESIELT